MSLATLLAEYGYLAVFAGSLLEGETILVLAGFASHQGYLSLPWVICIAFCGGTLGDQIFFFIGRRWRDPLLLRMPGLQASTQRIRRLLLRHHRGLIVGVRFMYGLRIIGPVVIGMSEVPPRRFLLFNMVGAAVWAILIPGAGYVFGEVLQRLLAHAEQYEATVALSIVVIAVLVGAVRWLRSHKD